MTDIKSRLIDGMRGQGVTRPNDEWLRLTDEHLGWIADRLLSLPGIAIVDETVWYVTTDTFDRGGAIAAGPFPTKQRAVEMRHFIERHTGVLTYWIDKQPWAAAVQAQEEQQ